MQTTFPLPSRCSAARRSCRGARDEAEWSVLHENLSTQRLAVAEDMVALHWEAARIFFDCRRRGITVRSSVDCLIAAQAIAAQATLLHDDEVFERIKKARKGLRTERG